MIKDYVSNTDINTNNLVDIEFTNDLLTNVNTKLEKIKSFKDHAIKICFGGCFIVIPKVNLFTRCQRRGIVKMWIWNSIFITSYFIYFE